MQRIKREFKIAVVSLILATSGYIYYKYTEFSSAQQLSKENVITVAEEVTFQEFHDPGYMVYTDEKGSKRNIEFFYSLIKFEDILTWEKDERIKIVLSKKDGAGIVRVKTGQFYKVYFPENNPIDTLTQAKEETGVSMAEAVAQAAQLYQDESTMFLELTKNNHATLAHKKDFDTMQTSWEAYKSHIMKAYSSSAEGSISAINSAALLAKVNKEHYQNLYVYFNHLIKEKTSAGQA